MFNFSDPETLWLNLTNAGLGLCVVICVSIAAIGILRDVMAKVRARASEREVSFDMHSMMMPDLGLTMADGGEPISENKPTDKK